MSYQPIQGLSLMNPRQQRFVEEYVIDLNATKAAMRAGYSVKAAKQQGSRMLAIPNISAHINALQREHAANSDLTHKSVLGDIKLVVDRCSQNVAVLDRYGEPFVVKTKYGELAAAYAFQPGHVLRGLELLGRHLGMFTGNIMVENECPYSEYTTEELEEKLRQIRKERGNIR